MRILRRRSKNRPMREAKNMPKRTEAKQLIDLYENAGDYSNAEDMVKELKEKKEYDEVIQDMLHGKYDIALSYWNEHPGDEADEYKALIDKAQKSAFNGYWIGTDDGKTERMRIMAVISPVDNEILYEVQTVDSWDEIEDIYIGEEICIL